MNKPSTEQWQQFIDLLEELNTLIREKTPSGQQSLPRFWYELNSFRQHVSQYCPRAKRPEPCKLLNPTSCEITNQHIENIDRSQQVDSRLINDLNLALEATCQLLNEDIKISDYLAIADWVEGKGIPWLYNIGLSLLCCIALFSVASICSIAAPTASLGIALSMSFLFAATGAFLVGGPCTLFGMRDGISNDMTHIAKHYSIFKPEKTDDDCVNHDNVVVPLSTI